MRTLVPVILVLMFFCFSVNGSPSLKTELSDENFMNRLRFKGESTRLSLALSINDQGFDWAEPSFVSPVISAGRMELKGLPRELLNPDGTAPGSSVYSENSRVRITDSFDRSSRFGLSAGTGSPSWVYRTNSGAVSAGIVSTVCSFKYFETDAYISAGTCPAGACGSWFDDHRVLPGQICINTAAELRAGSELPVADVLKNAGRKIMRDDAAGNRLAASFLAGISLPEYTEPGFLLRAAVNAGGRSAGIRGLFQWVGEEYLPPTGKCPSYKISAGFSAHTGIYSDSLETVFSCGYFYRQKKPEILPGRVIEQRQQIEAGIKLDAGVFYLKLDSDASFNHDINGRQWGGADFDAVIKIALGPVISSLSGGMDFEDILYRTSENKDWHVGAGVGIKEEPIDCSFDYAYKTGQHHFTPGIKIDVAKGIVGASVKIIDGCIAGVSAGFQSD